MIVIVPVSDCGWCHDSERQQAYGSYLIMAEPTDNGPLMGGRAR